MNGSDGAGAPLALDAADPDRVQGRTDRAELVGLAVAVALVLLTAARYLDDTALWLDEAYTLGAVNDVGASLRRTHGTMGLYYLVMAAWGQVSVATAWLRLPSVIFAIATLVVLRPVARRVGGPALAALAPPVAAVGPLFAWKATEARAYSLETLIVCCSWYALLRAIEAEGDADRRWWAALGALALAGTFSHGLFIVQLPPLAVVAVLAGRPRRAVLGLVPAAVAAGGTALWLHRAGAADIGTNVEGGVGVLVGSTLEAFLSEQVLLRLLLSQFVAIGAVLGVRAAVRTSDPTERARLLVPVAWTVVPCVALGMLRAFDPVYNPRYLAPIGPGLALLLVGAALAGDRWIRARTPARREGGQRSRRRVLGPVAPGLAVLLLVVAVTERRAVDDDWRGAARLVARGARAGDGLVFANLSTKEARQHRPPFEAAWAEVGSRPAPEVVSPPRPLGEVRRFDEPLPVDVLRRRVTDHPRVWIVEHPSEGADPSAAVLTASPAFDRRYDLVGAWRLRGGIRVQLHARDPAAPAGG